MKDSVLDSFAVIAYLQEGPGFEKIMALLERASKQGRKLLMCTPNWVELRYIIARRRGEDEWENLRINLLSLPIEIVQADLSLAEEAGRFKTTKRMSLADCFAAALARQRKAVIYTGDPEFKEVQDDIEIEWL